MSDDTETSDSHGVNSERLMTFIERKERLAQEMRDVKEAEKELNAEIKSQGFDLKWVNHCVKERAKDADARSEECAMRDTYESAAGL